MSALTHLCQIKSDHTCCLLLHYLHHLPLFNFHLCLKQWCKRPGKQREKQTNRPNKKSRGRDYAATDVVIWVNTSSKWDAMRWRLLDITTCWWSYYIFQLLNPFLPNNSPTGKNVGFGFVVYNMRLWCVDRNIYCSHVWGGYGRRFTCSQNYR